MISQWAGPGAPPIMLNLPSAASLTVCIYIDRLLYCMPYNNVANLETVTKTNMIRQNALWLFKNHCCENPAPSLPQSCAVVLAALEVSQRAAQRSHLRLKSPTDLRRGLRSSKIWLFYTSNLVASWMHKSSLRCSWMHLQLWRCNQDAMRFDVDCSWRVWELFAQL